MLLSAWASLEGEVISYFGFPGLMFTPTGSMPSQQSVFSLGSHPAYGSKISVFPRQFRFSWLTPGKRISLGFSSAYILTGQSVNGFRERTIHVPIIPSVKVAVPSRIRSFSMAFGAASPYGGYYALDWMPFKSLGLKTHAAFATKIVTYNAFCGTSIILLQETRKPVSFSVETAWGGSLKNLGAKEEAFIAVGLKYALCQSLDLSSFVRIDASHANSPEEPLLLLNIEIHKPRWMP